MKPFILYSSVLALFASLTISASAAALGTAFTYQGRLKDGANSANGSYDLKFTVFDVSEYGFPVGPVITNREVVVSDGLFQVELDFGDGVFTNSTRVWLEIGVRKTGGSFYTALTPRQPFTPTAYALYSPNAGTAVTAVSAMTAQTVATGSVGIAGLDTASVDTRYVKKTGDTMTGRMMLPVDGLSVGACQLDLSGGNLGVGTATPAAGVHIKTAPAWSSLNYGANLLLDGPRNNAIGLLDNSSSNPWAVGNSAGALVLSQMPSLGDTTSEPTNRFTITPQGNIGIGTNAPTARLHVAGDLAVNGVIRAAGQQYYTVGGEAFFPTANVNYTNLPGMSRGAFIASGSGTMVAPLHLPHGAVITEFRAYYTDNSTSDLGIILRAREFTNPDMFTNYEMASFSTGGTSGNTNRSTTSIGWRTVDNQNRSYVVVATSSSWSPDLRMCAAVVVYTVNTIP